MSDAARDVMVAVRELEAVQASLGRAQLALTEVLIDDVIDAWDTLAQAAFTHIESAQALVGRVQVELVRGPGLSRGDGAPIAAPATAPSAPAEARPVGASTPVPPAAPAPSDVPTASGWLETRGVHVLGTREQSDIDPALDRLAMELGSRHRLLEEFLEALKHRAAGLEVTRIHAHSLPSEARQQVFLFGAALLKAALLTRFRYDKGRQSFEFDLQKDGRVTGFLTGQWLERYVLQCLTPLLGRHGLKPETHCLCGARVALPSGDGELDLVLSLPSGPLWVECKTGAWQDYVERIKAVNRHLALPPERAMLVVTQAMRDDERASASALSGVTVMDLPAFVAWSRQP